MRRTRYSTRPSRSWAGRPRSTADRPRHRRYRPPQDTPRPPAAPGPHQTRRPPRPVHGRLATVAPAADRSRHGAGEHGLAAARRTRRCRAARPPPRAARRLPAAARDAATPTPTPTRLWAYRRTARLTALTTARNDAWVVDSLIPTPQRTWSPISISR